MDDGIVAGLAVVAVVVAVYLYRRRLRGLVRPALPVHGKEDGVPRDSAAAAASTPATPLYMVLVPSFVAYALSSPSRRALAAAPAGPRHDTSYLDGLRGLGSWAVFNAHTVGIGTRHLNQAYALTDADRNPWQLPVVRALHSGVFAVAVFFVVSGFALSLAAVRAMESPARDSPAAAAAAFQRSLGSAILRRPLRLYLPAWLCVVPTVLCVRLGVFEAVRFYADDIFGKMGGSANVFTPEPSWAAELHKMLASDLRMLSIFRESFWMTFASPYKIQLWTIGIEFRASLVLYLTHAALFAVPRRRRTACVGAGVLLALLGDNFDMLLFWLGYLLAERHVRSANRLGLSQDTQRSPLFYAAALLVACYVGALPVDGADTSPLYRWLVALTPPTYSDPLRFWGAVGAVTVVWVAGSWRLFNEFLSSAPIRYLGRISFGLYLMHTDVNVIFGWPLLWSLWRVFGDAGVGRLVGFAVGYTLLVLLQVCVADFFMRVVDQPSVRLAKRLGQRLVAD